MLRNQRGNSSMLFAVGLIGAVTMATQAFFWVQEKRASDINSARQSNLDKSGVGSVADTLLVAYRMGEKRYQLMVGQKWCDNARPFFLALEQGSGCAIGSVPIFSDVTEKDSLNIVGSSAIFSFTGAGCTIGDTSSDCIGREKEMIDVGYTNPQLRLNGMKVQYRLSRVLPDLHMVEFSAEMLMANGTRSVATIAISEFYSNSAHISWNGRTYQQFQQKAGRCPGENWGLLTIFDNALRKCFNFTELGGASGLLTYNGQYFGYRPSDGQIMSLRGASLKKSYLVKPDGTLDGEKVMPPYPGPSDVKNALINIDDLSYIDDQLYFVAGQGSGGRIGYVDMTKAEPVYRTVCDLNKAGLPMAFVGISAASASEPLFLTTKPMALPPLATFFLKSDAGDIYNVKVLGLNCDAKGCKSYQCSGLKLKSQQSVEYQRTIGFERTPEDRPYQIY